MQVLAAQERERSKRPALDWADSTPRLVAPAFSDLKGKIQCPVDQAGLIESGGSSQRQLDIREITFPTCSTTRTMIRRFAASRSVARRLAANPAPAGMPCFLLESGVISESFRKRYPHQAHRSIRR